MIISLEGLDNSGKTTVAEFLFDYYRKMGKKVFISKELTTEAGDIIKNSVTKGGLSPLVKTFLFAADRQIRLDQLNSNIDDPNVVIIFDRYLYSAVVYREAEEIDSAWVKDVNKFIPPSDFTFYIDITPEESIKRNTNTKFNIRYSLNQLEKIRKAYLKYVSLGELTPIDGMRELVKVQEDIIAVLDSKKVI